MIHAAMGGPFVDVTASISPSTSGVEEKDTIAME